eukprot:TRINITY_DN38026_c0_g1_i1.p1 TRINITY_DN38026_c0_g1~~TRINITY_DN38026_c0_g1_i1.p1  ORF type:complete len:100 (-),score=16.61 TRINITY_DN38026_c0_g1_i1:150-449(-)
MELKEALEAHKVLTISLESKSTKRKLIVEETYQTDSKKSMLEESYKTPITIHLTPPVLSLGYNWPLVSYKPNSVLQNLQSICNPDPEVQVPVIEKYVGL